MIEQNFTCIMRDNSCLIAWVFPLLTIWIDWYFHSSSSQAHSRKKRLIYYTSERRLTLPPGSVLVLTPTLSLPFMRNLPVGYGASMTISIPFKSKMSSSRQKSRTPQTWSCFCYALFRKYFFIRFLSSV